MSEGSENEPSNGVDEGVDSEMDRVGSKVLFENERVRIWEFKLEPGPARAWPPPRLSI